MSGPIEGIRIVDLTGVVMGPYATRILADLGADVVKVESPQGDFMRTVKPSRHDGMAGAILNLHVNKKSIVLDLKNKDALDVCRKLIATADVFIHSMRPAAIKRLGLSYADVSAIRPDIIYCNAFGFGTDGPYADRAAYDDVIQAASGIPWFFERARGTPDYVPSAICDKIAGITIAYSILAALLGRALGKPGQEIEVPMFETAVSFNLIEHMCGFAFEPALEPLGWKRVLSSNRKPFRTKDGYACILPYSLQNWNDFFRFIGREELVGDERFATHPGRIRNTEVLYAIIEEAAPRFTNAEWVAFCDSHSIPASPVNDLSTLWDDPHLKAVGLLGHADHPTEGRYKTVGLGPKFRGTPTALREHAPKAGQNSAEILEALGYSADEIGGLIGSGAVHADGT